MHVLGITQVTVEDHTFSDIPIVAPSNTHKYRAIGNTKPKADAKAMPLVAAAAAAAYPGDDEVATN